MTDDSLRKRGFLVRRLLPLAVLLVAGGAFLALGGDRYLTFAALARRRIWLKERAARSPGAAAFAYIAGYACVTALSVPGAAILTMTGGLLFGAALGALYAVIGATIGASLVFLAARAGLGGLLARAGPLARRLEAGFRADAFSYLLVLRLVPLFPFWLVNLVAAAAGIRFDRYLLATFFGMIPASLVFASLGNGLGVVFARGQSPDLAILLRPSILLPLLGLAILALIPPAYRRWRGKGAA